MSKTQGEIPAVGGLFLVVGGTILGRKQQGNRRTTVFYEIWVFNQLSRGPWGSEGRSDSVLVYLVVCEWYRKLN